jgi:hypothetical protein
MHDMIHAAIANERVKDLVEAGETRRAARDRKRVRSEAAKPARRFLRPLGSRGIAAMLRLRRGAM